ncbi:Retrotransposon gag protein [Corchorus olitorius]|uniref:Retrotransposon gag protein n=1 Tax=Corchorus olitorius TaxID=93759 RepID=A0A1R3G4M0_9ROSI|nr:Retrotransposon gag protein [Corchorus olitorius]
MAPKIDYAEAIAALTTQFQELKSSLETKLETNSSSIADLQLQFARLEKTPVSPSPFPTPPPLSSFIPSSSTDTTASNWMFRNHQLTDWAAFTRSLELCFSASGYLRPQVALFKIRQTTTVRSYQQEFEILANRVQGLTQEHLLNLFVSGLKPAIQQEVIMFNPVSHYHALELALMVEAKLSNGRGQFSTRLLPSTSLPALPAPFRPSLTLPAPPRPPLALPPPSTRLQSNG